MKRKSSKYEMIDIDRMLGIDKALYIQGLSTRYSLLRMNFNSGIRKMLPKKSDLFDKQGNLKVDETTMIALAEAMNQYKNNDTGYRKQKGRKDTALEQALQGITGSSSASNNEKVMAQVLGFHLKFNTSGAEAKSVSKMYYSVLHNQPYYEVAYFIEKGTFDISKLTVEQMHVILNTYTDSGSVTSQLTTDDIQEIQDRLNNAQGNKEDEKKDGTQEDKEKDGTRQKDQNKAEHQSLIGSLTQMIKKFLLGWLK